MQQRVKDNENFTICFKEGTIKKNFYEHRDYEPEDEKSLS